jgi:hypothetical protein
LFHNILHTPLINRAGKAKKSLGGLPSEMPVALAFGDFYALIDRIDFNDLRLN